MLQVLERFPGIPITRFALYTLLFCCTTGPACKNRFNPSHAIVLSQVSTPAEESPFEPFNPSTWIPYSWEQFQNQSLRGKFDLFRLDFLDFARFSGDFRMAIQKQDPGTWMRQETWKIGTDIGPGAILSDAANAVSMPVSIRLMAGREFQYNRLFDSMKAAGFAKPVTFMDLPLSAKRALAMRPGDFASLPVRMGVALGLEASTLHKPFAISAGTGMFWHGEFRLNFYRQDASRIRVKIAPSVERGLQVHGNMGGRLDVFGYSPGKLINYDRQAERFFGLDFFSWIKTRVQAGERYAFDYVFNLNDDSARIAFDAIVAKNITFKKAFAATRLSRAEIDVDTVLADLTPAEFLNQIDSHLAPDQRRVQRMFRGRNTYTSDSFNSHLGTKALETFTTKSLTANRLIVEGVNGSAPISAQIFSSQHRQRSWLSWFREHQNFAAGVMFTSSPDWSENRIRDIVFEWNIGQNDLAGRELTDLRKTYYAVLGNGFERLKSNGNLPIAGSAKRFSSTLQIVIPPEFLTTVAVIARQNPANLERSLKIISENVLRRYRDGRTTTEFFTETANSLSSGVWRGLSGEFLSPLVQATRQMDRRELDNYVGEVFRLMHKAPPGEILIPAFMLDLAQNVGSDVSLSLVESARGVPEYRRFIGSDPNASFRAEVSRALYSVTHTGYEN